MNDYEQHPEQDLPCSDNQMLEPAKAPTAKGRPPTPGPFGRMNPDPGDAYRATFTPLVKRQIVTQLRKAYDTELEKYDESLGYNPQTFGYCVYHLSKYRLKQQLSDAPDAGFVVVGDIGGLFRMQGGEYNLGVYKVGGSAQANIWESFPTTENGANPGKNEGQQFFGAFELSMLDDVTASRYVVVAHLGNPRDGLVAVYLCIPIESSQGKITRWGYAEQIFKADDVLGTIPEELDAPRPAEEPELPVVPTPIGEEPEGEVVVTALDVD